ncbi:hypothetical protein RJ640_012390 [Escallonia rubra]|uniref:Nitrate excretion transporter 1 n=1 Tax=Escallonia rubra TaxID=112253 RepID=A0AA88QQP0_9ASTE|nr:hypothetical protein RJ640_012390 [Escallonia rubra]
MIDDGSLIGREEARPSASPRTRGGWITFPFILATMAGLTLAAGGWTVNLIVYLIEEFNVKSIDAAQISNVVNGCATLFPVLGAILADSFMGCYSVIWISSLVSLMGIVLLTLTATLDSLRPSPCKTGTSICAHPSRIQSAVLFSGIALAALGMAGTRFTLGTMGANQFLKPKHQGIFFNWYFITMYTSVVLSVTAIIYVENNVSWGWGFGLCVLANALGSAIFVLGGRFYRKVKPQGSPFMGLACVLVAATRKRKLLLSQKGEDYYHEAHDGTTKMVDNTAPTNTFKFLNHAALTGEGDTRSDGSIAKPWRLCTVQQVEDLKTLIRILPLWSTGIFLSTPLGIQASLTVLQALTMDRRLGPHFKIPAGTMIVFVLIPTSIFLTLVDRFILPTWKKLTGRYPTPLQRIGVGHVLNVLSIAVSALVEAKRLKAAQSPHLQDQNGSSVVPMSVFWLIPPLAITGIGEAFHFPGQVALYYQEFPVSLKSTSTAVVALFIGVAYYLSTAMVDLVRRVTAWLPDDINHGRIDDVYWVVVVIGVLNFGYYLVCAWFYEYRSLGKVEDESSASDNSG